MNEPQTDNNQALPNVVMGSVRGNVSPAHLEAAQKAFERGRLDAVYKLLTSSPAEPEALTPASRVQADLLLGKLSRERGEFEEAKAAFRAALETAQHHELRESEANALNQLASIFAIQGDAPRALELLSQAADLFEVLGLMKMWAIALTNAGDIHRELSDYEEALTCLKKAYDFLKDADPQSRTTAINLQNLGQTYYALGNFERSEGFYKEALDIALTLDDPIVEVVSRINLAEAYVKVGKLGNAETSFESARAVSEEAGLIHYQINILEGLGDVYFHKALFTRAREAHQQAVDLAEEMGDLNSRLSGLLKLAQDEFAVASFGAATERARSALTLAEENERPRALYEAHQMLAQGYKAQGKLDKAIYHLEAFHALKEMIFNEQNADKTRRLSIKFEVEKARHEAEVNKRAQEQAERLVQERTTELEEAQLEIVARLAVAAEYRDDDTGVHTRRVGRVAALLAYVLGWDLRRVQLIYSAARLHDIGKIGISDTILLKPDKLTENEFDTIRTHATIGERILADGRSPLLQLAEEIAGAHHERWDGRGYPNKLEGNAIPQSARIVSVADVLDALIHKRPYKTAWPLEKALAELEKNGGSQFDPSVVTACLKVFGTTGPLSPSEVAQSWQEMLCDLDKIAHLRDTQT